MSGLVIMSQCCIYGCRLWSTCTRDH